MYNLFVPKYPEGKNKFKLVDSKLEPTLYDRAVLAVLLTLSL